MAISEIFSQRALTRLIVFLTISAAYLYTFPQTNIFYAAVVLLHALTGVLAAVLLAARLGRLLRQGSVVTRSGWALVAAGALLGAIQVKLGTSRPEWKWLYLHIILSIAGVGLLFADWVGKRGWLAESSRTAITRVVICLLALAGLGYAARYIRESRWEKRGYMTNPAMPPASMNDEGDGPEGAFFPSSAQVYGKQKIPSKFFMESDSCKRCHQDIYNQWFSSVHHFSSFNNQWYRKSIEYMQDTIGTKPSKWCGGCHDMAILLTGRMDTPIREQIHTPEAQAGIGCLVCHSIVHVHDTMGQGGFTLEYPEMHRLVASKNPLLRFLHDRMVLLDPGPHKATMLKPFHRSSTPEFCSTCHKVHLDVPVNHYRWFRGFNDYDAWQQSGVSMQGARAFYYPDAPKKCGSCHMPMVPSK